MLNAMLPSLVGLRMVRAFCLLPFFRFVFLSSSINPLCATVCSDDVLMVGECARTAVPGSWSWKEAHCTMLRFSCSFLPLSTSLLLADSFCDETDDVDPLLITMAVDCTCLPVVLIRSAVVLSVHE